MSKYIDNLTLLKGLVCIWVLLFHIKTEITLNENSFLWSVFSKGYLGVDFFFILSGFVITINYKNRINSLHEVKFFLKKRFYRLYPLHIYSLLVVIFFSLLYDLLIFDFNLIKLKYLSNDSSYDISSLVYNFFLIHSLGIDNKLSWNIPSWSISTEFLSYLFFSLYILFKNKLISKIILFITILSYFYLFFLKKNLNYHYDYGIIRNLFEFYIGYLIAKYYPFICLYRKKFFYLFAGIILASYGYFLFKIDLFFIIIFSFIILIFSFIKKINFYPLNKLGEISYSFYLNQWIIILIFKYINLNFYNFGNFSFIFFIILSNIFYSLGTYYFVEKKFYN
jgi:peptidoglycan/LPS O-acetylase OafA/YrhL